MDHENRKSLLPLPRVLAATRGTWSQIYSDADHGVPGPISRIGNRLYTQYSSVVSDIERFRPKQGEAELDRFPQPEGPASAL